MAEKKDRKILERLQSDNIRIVKDTIDEISKKDEIKYLDDIFGLYHSDQDLEIKKSIHELIKNMKSSGTTAQIIGLINSMNRTEDMNMLIAACWQSTLDFSHYLHDFVNYIINGDYETILESFTVIENSVKQIDTETADKEIERLKTHMHQSGQDKKNLIVEIIKLLELEKT